MATLVIKAQRFKKLNDLAPLPWHTMLRKKDSGFLVLVFYSRKQQAAATEEQLAEKPGSPSGKPYPHEGDTTGDFSASSFGKVN